MKKIIFSLILAIGFTGAYAQKSKVNKAKNYTLAETPDFKAARAEIAPALLDSTTRDLANTWYVAGLIGYTENASLLKKYYANTKEYPSEKGKAIIESYGYFIKAWDLDQKPDAKGKVKPKFKDIKDKVKEYYTERTNLVAYGDNLYRNQKYAEALEAFKMYLGIPKLAMMNNEIKVDSFYTLIQNYAASAATLANKDDEAIAMYEELKLTEKDAAPIYRQLYQMYQTKKDTVSQVRILKEGFEKFPNESYFLQTLINYYIYSKQIKEAMVYLNDAITKDPKNAQYYYVKGNITESLGDADASLAAFNKAIELDPKLGDAYAGLGRLYFNKAVKMSEEANKIKDNAAYNKEMKKVDEAFKLSLPFFKKAVEINPKDVDNLTVLKNLYYRLKMDADFNAVDKQIKEIKGN